MSEEATGTSTRSCGKCTACCKTHPILELAKPASKWCSHCQIGKGCAIYGDHPQGCKEFSCQWLLGRGQDGDRPDQVKIVIDNFILPVLGDMIIFFEVTEGSIRGSFATKETRFLLSVGRAVCHLPLAGRNTLYVPIKEMLLGLHTFTLNGKETVIVHMPADEFAP